MAVMVAGGAGYIGSHTAAALLELGRDVVVVDSLVKGHREAVTGGRLYVGDIRDAGFMDRVFTENDIDSVISFRRRHRSGAQHERPAGVLSE